MYKCVNTGHVPNFMGIKITLTLNVSKSTAIVTLNYATTNSVNTKGKLT